MTKYAVKVSWKGIKGICTMYVGKDCKTLNKYYAHLEPTTKMIEKYGYETDTWARKNYFFLNHDESATVEIVSFEI